MNAEKNKPLQHIVHPIPPLFDRNSRILILGSFPSVKSREQAFFYGHPQNRFWKLLPMLYGEPPLSSIPEKRAFCQAHGVDATRSGTCVASNAAIASSEARFAGETSVTDE